MDIKTLTEKAFKRDLSDASALSDAFECCRLLAKEENGFVLAHQYNKEVRRLAGRYAREQGSDKHLELYKKTLLFAAPHDYDSYLQYLEWNRKPEERFYLPRRRIMKRVADAMQRLVDDELDELFLSMPPRVGKALSDDTPILTKIGWKNHGDLVIGDEVVGMNGEFKKVVAIHPKCQLDILVEFTNGEKIQCHENHEWKFYDRAFGRERLEETKYWERRTLEVGTPGKRGHHYVLQLPQRNYVVGEEKDIFDPYLLGVWLGDGSNNKPRVANDKKDYAIIEKIIRNGFDIRWETTHAQTGVKYYDFDIRKQLQSYGMCHSRKRTPKHIPEEYLTASVSQRLELLAGLLDTDGCLVDGKRYQFSTCDIELHDTFVQLISTFGWRPCTVVYDAVTSSSGVVGKKPTYTVSFCPDCYIPCALERKQIKKLAVQRAVAVKSITRVEPKQGNCITVEGDGMYLAGRMMVPTHNTTMLMLLMTWLVGRNSEKSNLYSAFSDVITSAFYSGCLEIINDPVTYLWHDVFPNAKIVSTNAKDETFNIDRKKRYPSLTCRSLYGTLNGACDCNGMLVSDDLIGGIEEALNKDRLMSAWSKVDNNLIPRAKETAKILWCGTRWSTVDPAGLRMDLLQNDEKYKNRRFEIINLPALDENEQSNFHYLYDVGFSEEYYQQRRASFERNNDIASWLAQYMGEPIERSGALFEPQDMKFYNGVLPDEAPVRIFMAVDPAFGGGDFTSSPVCYQYSDGSIYVADVVYDNGDKRITQPLIIKKIKEHNVQAVQFEATKSTMGYKDDIEKALREQGIKINITTKAAPNNVAKEMRIFDKAPEIREFYFLEDGKRSREYSRFMQNVFSFKMLSKNRNDDSVDSLAQAVDMIRQTSGTVRVFKRPF